MKKFYKDPKTNSKNIFKIHPYYDGDDRTCKILFANEDTLR